jgi:hypothetical protein
MATVNTALSDRRRNRHLEMLVISLLAIGLSFLLEVGGEGRVFFHGFPDWPLPKTCFTRDIFSIDCPGCGLTRSYIYLAHGNWRDAWSIHRMGGILFIATALQIPYRIIALYKSGRELLPIEVSKYIGFGLIAMLILNWLIGIAISTSEQVN